MSKTNFLHYQHKKIEWLTVFNVWKKTGKKPNLIPFWTEAAVVCQRQMGNRSTYGRGERSYEYLIGFNEAVKSSWPLASRPVRLRQERRERVRNRPYRGWSEQCKITTPSGAKGRVNNTCEMVWREPMLKVIVTYHSGKRGFVKVCVKGLLCFDS